MLKKWSFDGQYLCRPITEGRQLISCLLLNAPSAPAFVPKSTLPLDVSLTTKPVPELPPQQMLHLVWSQPSSLISCLICILQPILQRGSTFYIDFQLVLCRGISSGTILLLHLRHCHRPPEQPHYLCHPLEVSILPVLQASGHLHRVSRPPVLQPLGRLPEVPLPCCPVSIWRPSAQGHMRPSWLFCWLLHVSDPLFTLSPVLLYTHARAHTHTYMYKSLHSVDYSVTCLTHIHINTYSHSGPSHLMFLCSVFPPNTHQFPTCESTRPTR